MRKTSAALLLSLTLFVSGIGFFSPRPAHAQLVVSDPVTGANTTINNFEDFLDKVLLGGVTMGFINALNYFAQKIAYDAAVFIAAGGKGEGPLFQYKDFGSYLGDVALGAAGEALGTFSEIGFLGFNLCEPSGPDAPRVSLALQLGIAAQYEAPEPRCEWSRIAESWDQFTTSFETGEVLKNVQLSIGPGETGLHGMFQAPLKVQEKVNSEKVTGELERTEGQGFKSLTDVVTGRQKTPAAVVRETALEQSARQPGQQAQSTASVIGPVLSQGVLQVLSVALGTFVNTLASELLRRAFEEGSFDVTGFDLACAFRDAVPESADTLSGLNCPPDVGDAEQVTRGGRAAARAAYQGLLAPRVQEVTAYDAVAEFTVCPDTFRGPQNCAMDPGFAAGVRVALQGEPLTVRDAIRQGYLHADWPLVPPTGDGASRNADPFCFNNGYCYSNLVKLRKARIIPIGFELAAEKALPDTTLGKVVGAFDNCDGPNGDFCKLIDPDWLLKYPITQCRAKVFGPTLLARDSDIRAEICVDAPTCIAENPDGTCGAGFGYCTREKNIWRLGGDACPAQYASCQAYQGPNGRGISALKNTVDKGICSVENAGCNWYATEQDPGDGLGDWRADRGRIFLDRDAGVCEEDAVGCSELVVRAGLQANLVRNPSFEAQEVTAGRPDAWTGTPSRYDTALSGAAHGSTAVSPGAPGIAQRIGVDAGEAYTMSFSARRAPGAALGRATVVMRIVDVAGTALTVPDIDSTCDPDGAASDTLTVRIDPGSDVTFTRDACTFTAPFGGAFVELSLTSSDGALVDALQLEYGGSATVFRATPYQGEQRVYLKQPPDWLGCTGEDTDPPECASYAGICRPDEIGCEAYTPLAGGLAIPGIVTDENRCPAECVGYATYKEEASTLSFDRYPVHLIPSRGRACSVASAGCTEFTNLDVAAAGGEAREYYATLRTCEKPVPGAPVPVYYTWEGSDTTGFQLKEWRLKAGVGGPATIRGTDPASCTRDIYLSGANPDCREFFDLTGAISYRLYSRTIVVTADCRPLRMTELPVDESATDAAACTARGGRFVDGRCSVCEGLGGSWNDPAGSDLGCTFNAFAPESRICTSAEAGCRLYTGNAGANVRREGFWDFEAGSRDGWGPDADTAVSTESTAVGGHSIRVASRGLLSYPIAAGPAGGAPRELAGNTYYLTFWAKGRGALTVRFSNAPPDRVFTAGGITLGATWNRYTLGPVLVDWTPTPDEALVLSGFADTSFVDRIELMKVASNIGLIKDSWSIPAVCDQNAAGAFLPQAQLGCSAYRAGRTGRVENLTGFTSLCREKAVGCSAFVATQQSPSPGRESWNALCVLDAPAGAPAPCLVDGREVCTVGVNRRSCRYTTDDLPPEVSFSAPAGLCQVDGIIIVDGAGVPVRLGAAGTCIGQPQDLVVVPPDKNVYLVENEAARCDAEFAGCLLTGRSDGRICTMPDTAADADADPDACVPAAGRDTCDCTFAGELLCHVKRDETACRAPLPFREPFPAGTQISYSDTPVLNDPKNYAQALCTVEAVGCQEWTEVGPTTGKAYFKDPGNRTCEFREEVRIGGREFDGWFRTGTDIPCDPTLLVSGETYGIWRNGDELYRGFVGVCPATFSTCSEFLDPADRDTRYPLGQPYYFLRNQKIDAASCRGQVNPLGGCVLFNDTSDPNVTANTVVTNAASTARGNAAVSPVTCPGPGCSQCVYSFLRGGTPLNPDEIFYRMSGTLCASNSDCRSGEIDGETSACITGRGSAICDPGTFCLAFFVREAPGGDTDIRYIDEFGSELPTEEALLNSMRVRGNDANAVISVTRDRVCGEWLSCQSSTPVWDPTRNRFIEICDSIGRCNEYQRQGDSTQCVNWVNREPQILTEDIYAARDVSYAGLDYSGYSIPHLYDVESLRQIPVGRFCTGDLTISCTSDAECAGAYGTCNRATRSCSGNPTRSCESDEDCGAGACNLTPSFRLARVIGTCPVTADEGSTCSNPDFPERGSGRCWQGTCAQAPNGSPVETETLRRDEPQPLTAFGNGQNAESPACRAYPEQNAPFPNSVVKTWNPPASDGRYTRAVPESTQPGFNRASTCEQGQACECTYRKIEYKGGQSKVYLAIDQRQPFNLSGICQGGTRDKQPCSPDTPASTVSGCPQGGSCQEIERNNVVQGLNGYCLERDLGFSINGLQEHSFNVPGRACITWLPVDRLSGAIDVYNNYPNAGFNIASAAYCAVPDAYKRVQPWARFDDHAKSLTINGEPYNFRYGCAESTDYFGQTDYVPYYQAQGETRSVRVIVETGHVPETDCPADQAFVVLSRRLKGGGDYQCEVDFGEDDDFQYICVPRNSRHLADPNKSECLPPRDAILLQRYEENCDAVGSIFCTPEGYLSPEDIPRKIPGGRYAEVWSVAAFLDDDAGLPRPSPSDEVADMDSDSQAVHPQSVIAFYADCVATDTPIPGGPGSPGTPFFGCEAAVEVATSGRPGLNKAFTGRIGNGRVQPPGSPYAIASPVGTEHLRYTWEQDPSSIEPYGRANTADIDAQTSVNLDFTPVEINTCQSGDAYSLPNAAGSCTAGGFIPGINPETRPYATISAGNRGRRCTPGPRGDLMCSSPTGTPPSCSRTEANVQGCYKSCAPDDGGDSACGDAGLGRCSRNPFGLNRAYCERPFPGTAREWSERPSACTDAGGELIGSCINSRDRDGNACRARDLEGSAHDNDCASVRCISSDPSEPSAGVCEGSGTGGAGLVCDGNGVCRSYDTDASGVLPNLANVLTRVQQIFARTYRVFLYRNQDTGADVAADYNAFSSPTSRPSGVDYDPAPLVYDISHTIGGPPVVRSVGSCNTQNQCLEGDEGQISVNDVASGQVTGGNGFKNVTLRFFAYAENDQMPIRNVTVDWGDGGAAGPNLSGNNPGSSYKNRRGYELRRDPATDETELLSLCDSHDFGTSSDACDSLAPFAFNHAYICNRTATARCFDGTNDCVLVIDGRQACVYKPRVQIQDNWGFCNGTCPGGPAGDSCYDATTNPTLRSPNECSLAPSNLRLNSPFTEFAGDVVVFPRE